MSEENNNAIIENQHSTYSQAILSIVHVDADAVGGLNGSILDPYANISPAISRVAIGGTVLVAAGMYSEIVTVNVEGITIRGESPDVLFVEGFILNAGNITIEGLTILE